MKALIISIHPEHALNILNGSKTLELRKSVPKGYVGWVYGYVTKGKPYLYNAFGRLGLSNIIHNELDFLNGTIPFRFWFDEYEEVRLHKRWCSENDYDEYLETYKLSNEYLCDMSCVSNDELEAYFTNAEGYAWHIKKLEVFDKPMKLEEFQNYMPKSNDIPEALITSSWQILHQPLTKAPQSWQYVWVKGDKK